ncbi:MAG: hypothetical protein ABIH08_05475 [Candidatus Omnitrophota bacterium]
MKKIIPDKRLFWFLKDNVKLDLTETSVLDMYIQQVITRGKTKDIKKLLKTVKLNRLEEAFRRLKHFIPDGVRAFWEDYLESN